MKLTLIRIYCFISLVVFCRCQDTNYNYDCGLAPSTPTDLTITNNTNQEVEVFLKVKKEKLYKFKYLNLSPNEEISICIEYEGTITDGIYVEFDNHTDLIKLKPQQDNEFNLKKRKLN